MKFHRFTKHLYFVSLLLIMVSFIGNKMAQRYEIYPFFWWQLFTNPLKGTTPYVMHRIYAVKANDTIRLANDGKNLDQVVYNALIHQIVEQSKIDQKQSISILTKVGKLKYQHSKCNYLLIEETYENPVNITLNNHPYAKKIILSTNL